MQLACFVVLTEKKVKHKIKPKYVILFDIQCHIF